MNIKDKNLQNRVIIGHGNTITPLIQNNSIKIKNTPKEREIMAEEKSKNSLISATASAREKYSLAVENIFGTFEGIENPESKNKAVQIINKMLDSENSLNKYETVQTVSLSSLPYNSRGHRNLVLAKSMGFFGFVTGASLLIGVLGAPVLPVLPALVCASVPYLYRNYTQDYKPTSLSELNIKILDSKNLPSSTLHAYKSSYGNYHLTEKGELFIFGDSLYASLYDKKKRQEELYIIIEDHGEVATIIKYTIKRNFWNNAKIKSGATRIEVYQIDNEQTLLDSFEKSLNSLKAIS